MIITLYSALIIAFFGILFSKEIHKYNKILYAIAIIVAILSFSETPNVVNLGYVPMAFFIVVLFSGLLEKNMIRKKLFTIRAELAIIGSILIFTHAFGYIEYYLEGFTWYDITLSYILGLLAYLTMLPLFITSFQYIRRKMNYKQWKSLHRLSYIFFLLVGLHLILIANDNQLLYILLFSFYFGLRIFNYLQAKVQKKTKKTLKKATN